MMRVKNFLHGTLLLSLFVFASCSKSKDSGGGNNGGDRGKKIKYKVTVTSGTIGTIVYGFDDKTTTLTSVTGTTWESAELDIPANVMRGSIAGNGHGNTAGSKITAEIFVDGNRVREVSGTGTALAVYAGYDF